VVVILSGEMEKPGSYTVPQGTILKDVLRKGRLKKSADLDSLDLEESVTESKEIFINKLSVIHVRVEGAVCEPLDLELPVGARLSDLQSKIQCTPGADRKFFQRRRLLKNKEIIIIPVK
jgi:hypothetical protein